jgi:hypothetical protein
MLNVLIVGFTYAALLAASIHSVRRINFNEINFLDGVLLGSLYFLAIPLGFSLFTTEVSAPGMRAASFRPYDDILATTNLYVGWTIIVCLSLMCRSSGKMPTAMPITRKQIYALLAALASLSLYMFLTQERHLGGHWMERNATVLRENTAAILAGNFANAFRAAIFGALIICKQRRIIGTKEAITIGAAVVMFDVIVTFNRITAAYFVVSLFIILRHRWKLVTFGVFSAAPIASYLSNLWTTVRAIALRDGFTLDGFAHGFRIAAQSGSRELDLGTRINSLFEASNIAVFKHVVDAVPARLEPLWGSTYVLRTFGVLVPSTFWPDKPRTFGVQLGYDIQGIRGLALNSTIFGEPYGNFYFLWPAAFLFALLLFNTTFAALRRKHTLAGSFGVFAGFAAWRFEMSFVMISVIAAIAVYFLSYVLEQRIGRTRIRNTTGAA